MFKIIGPNEVESDLGYSVRRADRFLLIYAEGDHVLHIEVEPGDGLAIYSSTLRSWLPPYDNEVVGVREREQILARIVDALHYMGQRTVVA